LAEILAATTRVADNTYQTIRFLIADKPPNPSRKPKYVLSVPPLTRAILDSLFNVVFLLENPEDHLDWYLRAGWREAYEEHDRYVRRHGDEAEWSAWLKRHEDLVLDLERRANITDADKAPAARRKIPYWPNPGKMPKSKALARETQVFLRDLVDWYYRSLSAEAHLSLPGLFKRAAPLMRPQESDEPLQASKTLIFKLTVVLVLALLSEVIGRTNLDLADRATYLWVVSSEVSENAQRLYEERYADLLKAK
jgi:hypothetical protein